VDATPRRGRQPSNCRVARVPDFECGGARRGEALIDAGFEAFYVLKPGIVAEKEMAALNERMRELIAVTGPLIRNTFRGQHT
jgi:predicted aspartyl protease